MDEIINYMDSCSVLGAEEYSFLKRKYDDEMILDSLVNVVSLKCDLIDDNESFYQFQLDLWKRYGYFFSLFRYYPFSSDILDRYESVTKNRGDDDASRIPMWLLLNVSIIAFLSVLIALRFNKKKFIKLREELLNKEKEDEEKNKKNYKNKNNVEEAELIILEGGNKNEEENNIEENKNVKF